MRKIYWYVTVFLRKHGWQVLLAFAVMLVFFSLILPYALRTFSQTKRYYIGVVGEYRLDSLPDSITQQISRSLTLVQPDGSFDLDLAQSLSIEQDGQIYRFTLPTNLYWQDGQELLVTDIDYHLPDTATTYGSNELVYTLAAPYAPFPQFVTKPLLRLETVTYANFWQRQKLIGIGGFELTNYKYRNNSAYSALSQVTVDNSSLHERYIYRFYQTPSQAILAFKKGEVDILLDIAEPSEIKDWPTVNVLERELDRQFLAVFFNNNDEIFTRNVRQALSYAVDKEWPGTNRAAGPIVSSSWAYFTGLKTYDKNLDQAIERFLDEIPTHPLVINITTLSTFYDVATRIATEWQELGESAYEVCRSSNDVKDKTLCENLNIEVNVNIQNFPDLHNYQVLLVGQEVSADPDQYNLWHSDVGSNFTHYKDTRVDSLLEKGRQTITAAERVTIYQEFQQVFLENPPAIFLWHLKTYDLARK